MWFGLILILVAVPLLELALLIKLGQMISFWATIAIIFLTAGIGFAILNAQGFAAFRRASASLAEGKPPVEPVLDGFMLMMAGGLLLIPPLRRFVARWGLKRMMASGNVHVATWQTEQRFEEVKPGGRPRQGSTGGTVIEGEFERLDEKSADPRPSTDTPPKPYRNGHAKDR